MRKVNPFTIVLMLFLFVLLSFWSVLAGIFKAGMEIGMLLVIVMIAVIVVVLVKLRRVYRKQH